jgi:hypothetical protein
MKQIVVAFLIVLTVVMTGLSEANDLTFSGDVSIEGSGNGLTFPDGTKQVTANPPANLELQCLSAMLKYEDDVKVDYCEHEYSLQFTTYTTKGLEVDDVFSVYCESPNPYNELEPVVWGLRCQEGWMNTGCSEDNDSDVSIFLNGCHSDNEEYGTRLWAICCRIAVKAE